MSSEHNSTGRDRGAGGVPQHDRSYRSPAALVGGGLLLLLGLWLSLDAVIHGPGRTRWGALAALVCFAPPVAAYTLRPAVFANAERLLVRNPLRTITISWRSVESLQAGYTSEVLADGRKYQLWSIPVSMRSRKRALRQNERAKAGHGTKRPSTGLLGMGSPVSQDAEAGEKRAASDSAIDELRELATSHGEGGEKPAPEAPVAVRWAYEILAPTAVGAVALIAFFATQ